MTEPDFVRRQEGGKKASDRYDALRHLVTATAFSCSQSIARVNPLVRLGGEGRRSRPLCRIRRAGKSFAKPSGSAGAPGICSETCHVPVGA
jgi:hypothetical protein